MLMPSIFGENLIDDFSFYPFKGYKEKSNVMKTDVKEEDDKYEIDMSIPGVNKEDIKAELKDGYLIVSAATSSENEEKDSKQRYIRRKTSPRSSMYAAGRT